MVNHYIEYITQLILELKAKNWDKKQIQVLQQQLDEAIKIKNKDNKANNKANKYPSNE